MGQNLSSILRQEVDPLPLMLNDRMLAKYYRSNNMLNLGYEISASVVGTLAHQVPSMKILEIGAGNGSATLPTLRRLGERLSRYDFTDISADFFDEVKDEQSKWAEKISKYQS